MAAVLDPLVLDAARAAVPGHVWLRHDAATAWFLLCGARLALKTGDLAMADLLIGTLALAVHAFEPIVARRVAAALIGLRGALAVERACRPEPHP